MDERRKILVRRSAVPPGSNTASSSQFPPLMHVGSCSARLSLLYVELSLIDTESLRDAENDLVYKQIRSPDKCDFCLKAHERYHQWSG